MDQRGAVDEEGSAATCGDGALADDARREEGFIAAVEVPEDKDDGGDAEAAHEADAAGGGPGVALLGELEGEEEHGCGAEEDGVADEVEVEDALVEGGAGGGGFAGLAVLEAEEDGYEGD